jgi:DNA polymerase-3 subunit alpha
MAAVLDAAADSVEEVAKSITECGRLGVIVMPVSVNHSSAGFTFERLGEDYLTQHQAQPYAIRFGLSAIKSVGAAPVQSIIAAREEGGPFQNLEDFCARVERHALNKRVVEAFIKSGAMDDLPGTRHQKLQIVDQAISAGIEAQKASEAGQSSLFDLFGEDNAAQSQVSVSSIALPAVQETAEQRKEWLAWEKEYLGMYISPHPVIEALANTDTSGVTPLSAAAAHVGKTCTFIGMVTGVRGIATKKGDSMLVAVLEDMESSIEMVAFPRVLAKYSDTLQEDAVLRISAKVDNRRDTLQLVVEECEEVNTVDDTAQPEASGAAWQHEPASDSSDSSEAEEQTPAAEAPQAEPAAETAAEPAPAAIPTLEKPVNAIKSRTRVSARQKQPAAQEPPAASNGYGNGNGNGHHNGPTQDLRLHLPRTQDLAADTRCMQDIHDLLSRHSGSEQITLYLPNNEGIVVLLPHYTVAISNELITALMGILGEDGVEVGPIEE